MLITGSWTVVTLAARNSPQVKAAVPALEELRFSGMKN